MRTALITAALALGLALPVYAASVPAPIPKALKPFAPKSIILDQGQLIVVLPQPRITEAVYGAVTESICGTVWLKQNWGNAKVREIYVFNEFRAQAYVFEGGKVECAAMAPMKTEEATAYKLGHTRTETCTHGMDYCLGRKK